MNTLAVITEFFGIFAVPFNAMFIGGMIIIAIVSVWGLKASYSKTAGIVIVLGILGTFTGIIIGLLNFDVNNIDNSIPPLLEGMKTAFATSIAGMVISTILKGIEIFKNKNANQTEEEDIALSINKSLKEIVKINQENQIQQKSDMNKLIKSLTGDGESTIMTQLQKLRTGLGDRLDGLAAINEEHNNNLNKIHTSLGADSSMPISSILYNMNNNIGENLKIIADGQTVLKDEFIKYSEKVQEYNYKALVNALEDVIKDFNTKINEQFGENFKHLNEGVGKMLDWQNNYKNYIDRVEDQIDTAVKGITSSRVSIQKIREEADKFNDVTQKFDMNLNKLNESRTTIEKGLRTFDEISQQAKEFLPALDRAILTANKEFETKLSSYTEILKGYTSDYFNNSDKVITDVKLSFDTFSTGIKNQQDRISQVQSSFNQQIERMVKNTEKTLEDQVNRSNQAFAEQYKKLDKQLEETLKQSIGSLGSNLASLSNRFVQDYTPLTNELQRLVRISREVA
jgi:hypothetical protein